MRFADRLLCIYLLAYTTNIQGNLDVSHGSIIQDATLENSNCAVSCSTGHTLQTITVRLPVEHTPMTCPEEIKYDCEVHFGSENVDWQSSSCTDCQTESPTDSKGATLPATAYIYSSDCDLICITPYEKHGDTSCALCDKVCEHGKYLSVSDGCETCQDCSPRFPEQADDWTFTSQGAVDDPLSCTERCKDGMYLDVSRPDKQEEFTCLPYSNPTCGPDQIIVDGTHEQDARCEDCIRDCDGLNMIQDCDIASNQQSICTPCPETPPLKFGEIFVGTSCQRDCDIDRIRNEETQECEVCNYVCPIGYEFASPRSKCVDCVECSGRPTNAHYVSQCNWECITGFQYNATSNSCYEVESVEPEQAPYRLWSPFTCQNYQYWTISGCQNCTYEKTPHSSLLGEVWNWKPTKTSCSWECMPGYYSFALSDFTWSCYTWNDYLNQVKSAEETAATTSNAHFNNRRKQKVNMLSEWQLLMISVAIIFTAVYAFH